MSRSVAIKFEVHEWCTTTIAIVEALLDAGWSYSDHGHISVIPPGEDVSTWRWLELNQWAVAAGLIREKEQCKETIGVVLMVPDAENREFTGGEFLITPARRELLVSVSINRRCITEVPEVTDYTWYLRRLVPPLIKAGLTIAMIECTEYA